MEEIPQCIDSREFQGRLIFIDDKTNEPIAAYGKGGDGYTFIPIEEVSNGDPLDEIIYLSPDESIGDAYQKYEVKTSLEEFKNKVKSFAGVVGKAFGSLVKTAEQIISPIYESVVEAFVDGAKNCFACSGGSFEASIIVDKSTFGFVSEVELSTSDENFEIPVSVPNPIIFEPFVDFQDSMAGNPGSKNQACSAKMYCSGKDGAVTYKGGQYDIGGIGLDGAEGKGEADVDGLNSVSASGVSHAFNIEDVSQETKDELPPTSVESRHSKKYRPDARGVRPGGHKDGAVDRSNDARQALESHDQANKTTEVGGEFNSAQKKTKRRRKLDIPEIKEIAEHRKNNKRIKKTGETFGDANNPLFIAHATPFGGPGVTNVSGGKSSDIFNTVNQYVRGLKEVRIKVASMSGGEKHPDNGEQNPRDDEELQYIS